MLIPLTVSESLNETDELLVNALPRLIQVHASHVNRMSKEPRQTLMQESNQVSAEGALLAVVAVVVERVRRSTSS
jgi:hypothetical protein